MNNLNHIPMQRISQAVQTMVYPPPPIINKDESDVYRWKSSFDFKKNINKMYYTNLSDRYELQDYLDNGYKELQKIVEFLQTIPQDMNNKTQTRKIKESNTKKINPRIYTLMKKYKNLLTHPQFQKNIPETQNPENTQNYKANPSKQSQNFQEIKTKVLKEEDYNEFNGHQLTECFEDLIVNHKYYSSKTGQQVVFQEIVKKISPRMNYNVYLPTMVKVILANVNWIDRENDTASLALKIEVKVNVPGISQYPYFYEQVFKEKMKISLKTQNRSNVFNEKIKFNKKNKEDYTFEVIKDKVFKKKTTSTYHSDAAQFYQNSYKWMNYDKPTYIYQKRIEDFEGFSLDAQTSDVRVLLSNANYMSPFEMIDLFGIVQLDSIVTEMKDWIQILYEKDDDSSLKKFLIEASPKVTIKFNLISLYQNLYNVPIGQKITLNHIRSFNAMESDGYKLAQNLMFLQTTNQRQSRYQLCKYTKCRLSYKWYRQTKFKIGQKIKKGIKKFSLKREEIKQENYYQISDPAILFSQLKVKDLRFANNKYELQQSNTRNIKQMNNKFQFQFYQIRKEIIRLEQKKITNQQENYYPQNLRYKNMQNILPLLKCMEKANIENQIYINNVFNQQFHENLSQQLSQQIYKFAKQKYKFQKYYRRVLEILISQLENQNGLYFQSEEQYLRDNENLQDLKQRLKQVIYNHDSNYFGENLANVKTDQDYHYPKAIYHFPFYKNPVNTVILLFSSPFVLCLINLFIFFQQNTLSDRLASVTALMICFIGMVAIMQKQIHSDSLSIFEILIYAMMFTPVLCLAFSFDVSLNHKQITIEFVRQSPLFWISVLISLLGLFFPVAFCLFYCCHEQSIYEEDFNIQKQMEPLFLLFPGSPQVDKILAKQQHHDQEADDDEFNPINIHKKQNQKKTLQRVVTTLMFKHLNNLYQLRKPEGMKLREARIKFDLHKSIIKKKKFIKNTFEIPKFEKNKFSTDILQSSTQIWDSPLKQRKTSSTHEQLMQEMFKFAYALKH